jgi:uncharacterized protein
MWATEPHPEHEGIAGVTFDSDGHRLVGTIYLARGEEPKPTVLLLHGCPGLEKNLDLAVLLRDRGWNSLLFHYRGCWGSAGRYDLRTVPRDVAAAVEYLCSSPAVDSRRIAVVGHSMGGWAAIVTAAAEPRLRAVATYGAPARLGASLRLDPKRVENEFTRFLAATPAEFAAQLDEVARRTDALAAVAAISPRPLLIVHGTEDRWVPVAQARELRERAGPSCRYVEVDDADHAFSWHRTELRELIAGWLDEARELAGSALTSSPTQRAEDSSYLRPAGGKQLRFAVHRPGCPVASPRSRGVPRRDVPSCVHVGVDRQAAGAAPEPRLALSRFRVAVPAARAGLRRVRGIDLLYSPGRFLLQAAHQQAPARSQDLPVKPSLGVDLPTRVLLGTFGRPGHVPDLQVLDPDYVETTGDVRAGLLRPVLAPIGLADLQPGDRVLHLPAAARAAPRPGEPPLQPHHAFSLRCRQARHVQQFPGGQGRAHGGRGIQPVAGHANILSNRMDILGEVKRRFFPA